MYAFVKTLKYHPLTVTLSRCYFRLRYRKLKRIVFVATTGRSGTMALAKLLNAVPNCKAEHEPYPMMFDEVLKAKAQGDESFVRREYWERKSVNLWRAAVGFDFYCDINHLFVKTYLDYAMTDFGTRVAVVHLVRDPVKVANSIYALQDFPGTEQGNKYWLDYGGVDNLIRLEEMLENDPEFSHPFYKGLWYWYEVEARIADWRLRYPQLKFYQLRTEFLGNSDQVSQLLNELGMDSVQPGFMAGLLPAQVNVREYQKIAQPLPNAEAEQKNALFKQLLASKGYL